MSVVEHLSRASMAIRGVRPSFSEIDEVRADPGKLAARVDAWLDSDAFASTIEDLHAELYLLRADTNFQLPVRGILEDYGMNQGDLHFGTVAGPLELVRSVVMEEKPYTEILTADYTIANEVIAAVYGLPYDPLGPEWQVTEWTDGRPISGLLSDSEIWRRHVSNAANFHRGRANFVSRTFLCEDIGARDVFVAGGVDIADEGAVAEAVGNDPGCVACHSALDPLAAFFWGYKEQLQRGAITEAYNLGCEWDWENGDPPRGSYRIEHWCYPLKFYDVSEEGLWYDKGLRPPGFFGHPATDVIDLGQLITEDARFAECTTRNFASYLTQVSREDLPDDWVSGMQHGFVESGFSAKELVRSIVLSDAFSTAREPDPDAFAVPLQTVRPEQLSRSLEDLTGFRWMANQDASNCATALGVDNCWGAIDLLDTDLYGVRSMMGGIDGYTVTHPTHIPTPTQLLALRQVAQEAAGFVVEDDFGLSAANRRLLSGVERETTGDAQIREQLVRLHIRLLGEEVDVNSAEIDLSFGLWAGVAEGSDPVEAWKVTIAALLRDPRSVLY